MLPFGIQSTKLHLHNWKEEDFKNFENFIMKNSEKIISYDQALSKVNDSLFYKFLRIFITILLRVKRLGLDKVSGYKIKD